MSSSHNIANEGPNRLAWTPLVQALNQENNKNDEKEVLALLKKGVNPNECNAFPRVIMWRIQALHLSAVEETQGGSTYDVAQKIYRLAKALVWAGAELNKEYLEEFNHFCDRLRFAVLMVKRTNDLQSFSFFDWEQVCKSIFVKLFEGCTQVTNPYMKWIFKLMSRNNLNAEEHILVCLFANQVCKKLQALDLDRRNRSAEHLDAVFLEQNGIYGFPVELQNIIHDYRWWQGDMTDFSVSFEETQEVDRIWHFVRENYLVGSTYLVNS